MLMFMPLAQCDMKVPGCSQCWRARMDCPGYLDAFSLRLRDQTATTTRKAQGMYRNRTSASMSTEQPRCGLGQQSDRGTAAGGLAARQPGDAPDDLALAYFMNVYAPSATFNYLPGVSDEILGSENLRRALLAPSLLMLSQNHQIPEFQSLSQHYYTMALRSTNLALSSPQLATLDGTLLSVLLLGFFEALSFRGRQTPTSWNAHTRGSVELLRLRGHRQFGSPLGRRLFLHASSNIKADCAQRCASTPPGLDSLLEGLMKLMGPADRSIQLAIVLEKFSNLRANSHSLPVVKRLRKAREVDGDLAAILHQLSTVQPFDTIDAKPLPGVTVAYEDSAHRYEHMGTARVWNIVRIIRLFVLETVNEIISWPGLEKEVSFADRTKIQEYTKSAGASMISGILNSVPMLLDWSEDPAIAARFLIFPLTGIAMSALASPRAVQFARDRLSYIGSNYRFPQAIESVNMALQSTDMEDW